MSTQGSKTTSMLDFSKVALTIITGLLIWSGNTIQQTSIAVAKITEVVSNQKEHSTNQDREILEIRARIAQIEIDLARLKARNP